MKLKKISTLALTALMTVSLTVSTYGAPTIDGSTDNGSRFVQKLDNRTDPLTTKQLELKEKALNAKLDGKANGKTYQVAKGQYVELDREGEGEIWTLLGEYSDLKHNTMPEPDRKVNNTTLWKKDFSRQSYLDLLFNDAPGANSMSNFYKEQSSNRYTVTGDVTDWVSVPGTTIDYDDTNDDQIVWKFLQDEINAWYNQQVAAGKTPEQIDEYLKQFDKWDRYDYDGDGNFDEPDGYIDTFQSVHAGEGEEAGAPTSAIWSHSWYAFSNLQGKTGPDFNKLGGIKIGDSNLWVGKYTVQPENGGVGVFTHEFGHDLGLPDLYDTASGENGTGFWTLMSSGSWMSDGTKDIGSMSSHMGAWEKLQLGWLNYEMANPANNAAYRLGPMEFNTKQAQAVIVNLPKKPVTTKIGTPYAGSNFYYSGSADDLNNYMYKPFNLPAGATLSAKVKYDIESGYDYAYLVNSTDNGATWQNIQTNLSESADKGSGITGSSGNQWVELTANLPEGNVLLGFRYYTDGGVSLNGLMVDDINITGNATDGAEADAGWTFKPTTGFHATTGTESKLFNQYYVAEYRTYQGYDSTLKTGPYYFGYLDNPELGDKVDHFPYQDGLLINFWDTSQKNNNTRTHPGQGLILPIDAHYKALTNVTGAVWRNRIQAYDATFTLSPTDRLNLHVNSVASPVLSQPAVKVFDDSIQYWDPSNPWGSVKNPNTGTVIAVRQQNGGNQPPFMEIQVRTAK